jgi:hypothetical protein
LFRIASNAYKSIEHIAAYTIFQGERYGKSKYGGLLRGLSREPWLTRPFQAFQAS